MSFKFVSDTIEERTSARDFSATGRCEFTKCDFTKYLNFYSVEERHILRGLRKH